MNNTLTEDFRSVKAVPSLVHSCQRVLAANIDAITSFGDGIPHRLIRPILQGCSPDTLLRLEQETPNLQERTSELWKDICVRVYPIAVEQMLNSAREEPESWREEFFCIREREARRFEEAASRIRSQRIEAEELKRKRQVKLTDRLPPPKRSRSGFPMPPKTLFEKTRKEATKIQKSVFGSRSLPPAIGNSKGFRAKIGAPSAQIAQKDREPVSINTTIVRNPCTNSQLPTSQAFRKLERPTKPVQSEILRGRIGPSPAILAQSLPTPETSGTIPQRDTTSTLFLPRQRTNSQLSSMPSLSSTFSSR